MRREHETPGVVEGLGLAMRGVNEVRVGCAEIASKFVESITPDECARGNVQHAVFGIKLVDRRAPTRRVPLAENLLKVTMKQFVDSVLHKNSDV